MTDTTKNPDLGALPPHLQAAQEAAKPKDAKLAQTYRFEINWTAPNGEVFSGVFAHKAPTVGDVIAIEMDRAKRMGPLGDEDKISGRALELIGMIAHMERTLLERPAWAKSLEEIPYAELFNAVALEVSTHVETFCVREKGQAGG